nr:rhodanese-like domain-containing protein [uncultured Roseococcus sp.]
MTDQPFSLSRRGIASLALGGAAVALQARSASAQQAAAPASQALVSTEWLAANLRDPKVRIIEVSVNPGLFERGHIPGATNVSWHRDLVETVRRDIASRDQIQNLLRRAGVTEDSTVASTATTTTGSPPGAPGCSTSTACATSASSTAAAASGRRRAARSRPAPCSPRRRT